MVQSMQHFRFDRIPDNLLRDPLEFLVADHVRQRKICAALDALVHGTNTTESDSIVAAIVTYLSYDLPLHVADKELDLFPALLRANGLDDNTRKLIDDLKSDHAHALSVARNVIALLRERLPPVAGSDPTGRFAELATALTGCLLDRLSIEERTLFPLARTRLSTADLERIGRAMAARRQIDYPD